MGTENLSSKSDLIQFGFHQLIETIAEASSMSLDELENTLIEESIFRFFSNPKINFPAGDIEQVAIQDEEGKRIFQIITNFLGLQGASGPLPGSILDEIAESSYDNESIQAQYLDFFNHHLLAIFHQIWRKYKYYIRFKPDFSDNYSRNILNILGLSKDFIGFSHLNWNKIFYYIGIIQSGIRTPQILADIIRHYFDLDDVFIEEHVRQLVEVENEQKNKLKYNSKNLWLEKFVVRNYMSNEIYSKMEKTYKKSFGKITNKKNTVYKIILGSVSLAIAFLG